ncbi:MAG: MFS transporter [Methylacidiphilales bacterium]|nr:MFS transporter [Candidatus Methylacidiphilales bacterium]
MCRHLCHQQFLRGSVGVIAPDLARELALNAAEIGLLSSLFFLMFAIAQVPLGIAIDRFGPRACLLGSVSLAIAGSLLFAFAGNFAELLGARLLMGLGCAALLVAPLAVYARWFPPDRFSTLLGIQMAVGSLGALLATAPLARAAEAFGWRNPFLVVAILTAVGAVLAALVIRDNPPGKPQHRNSDSLSDSIRGVAHAIRTPDAWRLFLLHTCGYAMYASIQGLWGGPYLTDVYGFDLAQRGDMLLLMAVAQICGSFLWGFSDRLLDSYRWPTMIGAIASAVLLLVLAAAGPLPRAWLPVWFAAFGLVAAFTPVMMAHGKSLFPPHLVGRGIT